MSKPHTRVLLVSSRQLLVDSLAVGLNADRQLEVMTNIGTDEEAAQSVRSVHPHVIVLDEERSGVVDLLHSHGLRLPTIVFFMSTPTRGRLELSSKIAVRGCVSAAQPIAILIQAIKRVADGGQFLSGDLEPYLEYDVQRRRFDTKHDGPFSHLSARQLEIVSILAQGLTAKEAASQLDVTPKAIENQKYRIMKTLQISDRVELSRLAIREGLISP